MSASQRRKGANGEREFLGSLGLGLERNLEQVREGGSDARDCALLEAAEISIEIKRTESLSFGPWFRKARKEGVTSAVAHRANRQPWRVYVEFSVSDFREFLLWKAKKRRLQ